MKKFFANVALVTAALFLIAVPALAEEIGLPMNTFFDWEILLTMTGAVLATTAIVQFIKLPVDKVFGHVPTWIIVYAIALVLMLLAQAFAGGGLTVNNACLCALNAVLVALAATKAHESYIAKEKPQAIFQFINDDEDNEADRRDDEDESDEKTEPKDEVPPVTGGAE